MGVSQRLSNLLLRRLWTGEFRRRPCTHLHLLREVGPTSDICEACLRLGHDWPALRVCLTCGYVGCCDKSRNRHALKHFDETAHPLVAPHGRNPPGWIWCRVDKALLDPPSGGSPPWIRPSPPPGAEGGKVEGPG
jgi:hypothetical protein